MIEDLPMSSSQDYLKKTFRFSEKKNEFFLLIQLKVIYCISAFLPLSSPLKKGEEGQNIGFLTDRLFDGSAF
jgi:hypothetical protein